MSNLTESAGLISGTPTPYHRGPGVYSEAIGESLDLVKQDLGCWTVVTLVYFGIGLAVFLPIGLITRSMMPRDPAMGLPGFATGSLLFLLSLAGIGVQHCILMGMILMGVRKSRGEPIHVGIAFEPFQRLVSTLGSNLLYYLILYVAVLSCILPSVYCGPVLFMMPVVAYVRGQGPKQALKTTYHACKTYWAGLLGLGVVMGLILLLGLLACGVGLLVAWPVYCVVLAIHYRAFFESSQAPAPAAC